jgi:hypothetical protein
MNFEEVCFPLDEDRLEASLQEVTGAFVPTIEVLGVSSIERVHPSRQVGASGLSEEVVMVSHEAVGVEKPRLVGDNRRKNVQEASAIGRVTEYRAAFVASARDVIQRTREFQSEWSRHMSSLSWIVVWQVET